MLFFYLLVLIAAPVLSFTKQSRGLRQSTPQIVKHGMFRGRPANPGSKFAKRAPIGRRQASGNCATGSQLTVTAPKPNIFAGLTNDEAGAVTTFLHGQQSLNLTAIPMATE